MRLWVVMEEELRRAQTGRSSLYTYSLHQLPLTVATPFHFSTTKRPTVNGPTVSHSILREVKCLLCRVTGRRLSL